jgi:hypothetical protein
MLTTFTQRSAIGADQKIGAETRPSFGGKRHGPDLDFIQEVGLLQKDGVDAPPLQGELPPSGRRCCLTTQASCWSSAMHSLKAPGTAGLVQSSQALEGR